MKKIVLAILACVVCLLTACEKHDGISYFKSKCVAELNGHTYVDQTPFTISPDAIVTPELRISDESLSFVTMLRAELGGEILYTVNIKLYANEPDAFFGKEITIDKVDFELPDGESTTWDYVKYCLDNKISYATVNGDVVTGGTFKIASFDKERGYYQGSFTLNFTEGTLIGHFEK